jgi:hypothetical protein
MKIQNKSLPLNFSGPFPPVYNGYFLGYANTNIENRGMRTSDGLCVEVWVTSRGVKMSAAPRICHPELITQPLTWSFASSPTVWQTGNVLLFESSVALVCTSVPARYSDPSRQAVQCIHTTILLLNKCIGLYFIHSFNRLKDDKATVNPA